MTHRHLDSALRQAVILGTLAVLLIPAARGSSEWLGWLPLWLVGMPLAAWWSLRGFPLPAVAVRLPRRRRVQATRRSLRRVSQGVAVARRA
ncbi:MAG TPA: hypothetical protein PK227_04810 [Thermomonas sp.]|jgi:hypothetical protein|uniref:hypothetical protein n=1 Tax=Thermomonas sp. TaxID=1971895 RepID=UPI002CD8CECA|nr:hypothetical protein [Thermomonas sp.]HOU64598.1 hypothetical protein [Thermomonas sp.]HPM56443.1 hypothetical protein [Thermomonas sp.]